MASPNVVDKSRAQAFDVGLTVQLLADSPEKPPKTGY